MSYSYDEQNIFAKILRGDIPNKTVLETDHALAFEDIAPQAPTHVLVIPKGPYVNYDHFAQEASDEEILGFTRAIGDVCKLLGINPLRMGWDIARLQIRVRQACKKCHIYTSIF